MQRDTMVDLRRLPRDRPHKIDLTVTAKEMTEMVELLDLIALRKLRLTGAFAAQGQRDWTFVGQLGGTVVQPCVATLDPVTTRIETEVRRHYAAEFEMPEVEEAEMPDDDSVEPLPDTVELIALAREALSLALPLYPRADEAPDKARIFGPPGVAPMDDEAAKPLAGLAALRDALTRPSDATKKDDPPTEFDDQD